ncbi:rhodanese-like domain-containing protein [Microbispora sp. ATCC PTA-5024]|uniref:rhodanese-like domain-containing protein n=1 Tax=Microbispora sp. ATCC PTA-5024 TaxID=316330 RepID=UPI0003DDE131|nr:rhodanese-like domain-containing protein [Microbispora sp. ATCC PTA-5024]ETK34856.1 sulfurtransferase [Microbispora sp. ATCC PTA-5024]
MTMPEIAPAAVPKGAYLLDVREIEEWRAGHAPEAEHIPLGDLQQRVDEVPADRPVYVVCRAGGRSAHATLWLNHVGRDAVNVGGGMQSWAAAGLPMVSESGEPPFVA